MPPVDPDREQQVIVFLAEAAVGVGDARGEQIEIEADAAQPGGEQPVQLVGKTAAPRSYNFAEQSVFIQHDGAAQVDVEILEGDS